MAETISLCAPAVNCRFTPGWLRRRRDAPIIRPVPPSTWEARIDRAQSLSRQFPFAAEMLSFYVYVARFQLESYQGLEAGAPWADSGPHAAASNFARFLSLVGKHGPARLAETARELAAAGMEQIAALLETGWSRPDLSPSQPEDFLVRAFLQPRAVLSRTASATQWNGYNGTRCPFCARKPGAGILRPRGDGGQRSLLCSFCLAEWEFRRILCVGCGETDHQKLPIYHASGFDYIRIDCCDTCKQYLKTVDLTKNGLADPVVDEIAAAPLDLWAREQGYSKLELNLVGM